MISKVDLSLSGGSLGENGAAKAAEVTNVNLTASNQTGGQGTMNIVVGPNGDASAGTLAMQITNDDSGWTLGSGQTINIYQAANSLNPEQNSVKISQCVFVLFNVNKDKSETESTSALTLNGGTLNVVSGAFVPTAGTTAGLTVNNENSTVTVSSGAQLQPSTNIVQNNPSAFGLSILNGTVNNNGYLIVLQNYTNDGGQPPSSNWGYAAINGVSGLNVKEGGTVQTSTSYPANSTNLTNGVWIQSSGNNNAATDTGNNPISATTNNITAFGTATLYTGFSNSIALTGSNTLTINSGANLTIPDGYTLNFGTTNGSSTTDGTLTVNGELTISEEATVNMYKGSVLTNNGTINVEQPASGSTPNPS